MIERNEEVEYANKKCGQMGNLMNEHCLKSFPQKRCLKQSYKKKKKTNFCRELYDFPKLFHLLLR